MGQLTDVVKAGRRRHAFNAMHVTKDAREQFAPQWSLGFLLAQFFSVGEQLFDQFFDVYQEFALSSHVHGGNSKW